MTSVESSAIQLLRRAVELDQGQKYDESLTCYEQGIRLLLQAARDSTDSVKKDHFKKKVDEYLGRAEQVKILKREEAKKKQHTQINIPKGATGFGYYKLFGPYLDSTVNEVAVKDPYIRGTAQLYNFQRFCEMVISLAANIKTIHLLTSKDETKQSECRTQSDGLKEITEVLAVRNIKFNFKFSESLHDREIRFSNGWTIQLGRGLDYFQRMQGGRFAIGSADYDLRLCMETTIDIFHCTSVSNR